MGRRFLVFCSCVIFVVVVLFLSFLFGFRDNSSCFAIASDRVLLHRRHPLRSPIAVLSKSFHGPLVEQRRWTSRCHTVWIGYGPSPWLGLSYG